jgi:hypothetical protein
MFCRPRKSQNYITWRERSAVHINLKQLNIRDEIEVKSYTTFLYSTRCQIDKQTEGMLACVDNGINRTI